MVTYNHVTEVVRSKCVNHKARRVDSRAILIFIATSAGALIDPTIKKNSHRYCSSNKQTQQIKLYTYHSASVYP